MSRDDEIRSRLQRRVANLAENGELIDSALVAVASPDGRRVTLRHEWHDLDGEEEIYERVYAAALRLAQEIADATGREVDLRDCNGAALDYVAPCESS